jgi:nicotinamidase-related amidase
VSQAGYIPAFFGAEQSSSVGWVERSEPIIFGLADRCFAIVIALESSRSIEDVAVSRKKPRRLATPKQHLTIIMYFAALSPSYALVIIDMQKWMFRYPDRAAQLPFLITNINRLAKAFVALRLPIFDVQTIHKADRSTWSRLMHKHNHACLIEGTGDVEPVDGYQSPPGAMHMVKTANSAFLETNFAARAETAGATGLVVAGVFIDGCVGLTAADAAQRGFDVTLAEDAIGHARSDRRATILNWLSDDYELEVQATEQILAGLHANCSHL